MIAHKNHTLSHSADFFTSHGKPVGMDRY